MITLRISSTGSTKESHYKINIYFLKDTFYKKLTEISEKCMGET